MLHYFPILHFFGKILAHCAYWYCVPGDAFWSCFGLVRTSLLANSPRVQSHVHSPTDRNVLCTRAKHVEAYGSWLRCDGALLYSMYVAVLLRCFTHWVKISHFVWSTHSVNSNNTMRCTNSKYLLH